MKLTYKDKVQIYELRKQGYSLEQLSNNHKDIGNTVIGRESCRKLLFKLVNLGITAIKSDYMFNNYVI